MDCPGSCRFGLTHVVPPVTGMREISSGLGIDNCRAVLP